MLLRQTAAPLLHTASVVRLSLSLAGSRLSHRSSLVSEHLRTLQSSPQSWRAHSLLRPPLTNACLYSVRAGLNYEAGKSSLCLLVTPVRRQVLVLHDGLAIRWTRLLFGCMSGPPILQLIHPTGSSISHHHLLPPLPFPGFLLYFYSVLRRCSSSFDDQPSVPSPLPVTLAVPARTKGPQVASLRCRFLRLVSVPSRPLSGTPSGPTWNTSNIHLATLASSSWI